MNSVLNMISGSGLMVQFILLLLFLFSVSTWTIVLIKFFYIKKAYNESNLFTDLFWKSKNLSEAFAITKQFPNSPIARVFRIGYLELKKISQAGTKQVQSTGTISGEITSIDNVQRALRRSTNTEINRLTELVPFLATAGNTTPFIGLFGTVWGIMNSFHDIGKKGAANLATVAPGISEALIATAAGLAVAIPAVIAFNYFMNRVRVFESELQSFSADFLNIIERDILLRQKGTS
ncbi:MAG: protein TolQ [Desulfobacterales bacterium]|nr:protein TolQ [Desulfobacterales bacterium]